MPDNWIEIASGPASGLLIAFSIIIGLYRLAAKYLPKVIEKHLENLDRQMETQREIGENMQQLRTDITQEHAMQTEAFRKSLAGVHQRFNPLQDDLRDIRLKLNLPENPNHPPPIKPEA